MALEPIVVSGCLSGRALKNKSQATKYFKSRCYFNFFFFYAEDINRYFSS